MSKKNPRTKDGFGMVANSLMRDPEISLREKGLYAYLSTYADYQSNELTVSVYRISAECGVTVSTVKRLLEKLRNQGVIIREIRGNGQSYKTTLIK